MKKIILFSGLLISQSVCAMSTMSDEDLSDTNGQALFNLSYLAPSDSGNNESVNNIGFYKLGIEAEIAANLNIKKLQLGCGGINGVGGCDIDIDHFSLSGVGNDATSTVDNAANRAARVQSDATLTNPFFQFAIKNPQTAATREIVGFRIGSEAASGLLTFGTDNTDTPNGINSLSGYMSIGSATGTANTLSRTMTKTDTGKNMTGRIIVTDVGGATISFSSDTYNLTLSSAAASVTTNPVVVTGNRMPSVHLNGTATIAPISFAGSMTATVLGFVDLQKNVTGSISGLTATVPIDQNLGYIHKLPVNNPFSLSVQGQDLYWPGMAATSLKGWWMAFEDQIDIGSISPADQVAITNAVLSQALGPEGCSNGATPGINCALYATPIACKAFGSPNCFGGNLPVGDVDITGTNVNFPLSNLRLGAQYFTPNCYGGLKFC
ncbi:MAG TPA: hypothetical protein PLW01_10885 [Agitococcus sp.]|nr:hypothetical protein [Agitococcus sp.]